MRRSKGELKIVALDDRSRVRARALAAAYLGVARDHVGQAREDYDEAAGAVEFAPRERKLAAGLRKLVEDGCVFEAGDPAESEALRAEVFAKATRARRDETFDRQALLDEVAREKGISSDTIERALYADLRGAARLVTAPAFSPQSLVDGWDLAQAQAVLLRAVRLVVDVKAPDAAAARALFRKLKFLRLLHCINHHEDGWRIEIDGPYSLFAQVTRYGLELALALPAIAACGPYVVEADVRWGREREALKVRLAGAPVRDDEVPVRLPDEVQNLLDSLRALETEFRIAASTALLDLPGVGVCVPDLVMTHAATGKRVYVEVLGYWSRDAVWRRIELAQKGMSERVLFCVSEHLRVSEAALPDDLPSALVVYKHKLSAKIVVERAMRLLAR